MTAPYISLHGTRDGCLTAAPPRSASPPCAALPRPNRGMSGFWVREVFVCVYVSGYAVHEKSLQKQNGGGPLVSSQEQRALLVLVINRLSTARQPVVVFLHRFKLDFACPCFWRDVQGTTLRCFGGCEGRVSLGQTILSASCPARPRPAVPMCAPTRPARGMSGFWTRQVFHTRRLSNPKPGHTTGASGRSARRGGGAGSGRTGCQQNCSPRKQASLAPSKTSKTRFRVSPEARTSEILCKPMEEQNPRLNRG